MKMLREMGVYEIVQPELEAGLEITRQALLHLNMPPEEILRFTDAVRLEHYAPLQDIHSDYRTVAELQKAARLIELNWVKLPSASPLTSCSLGECNIRRTTGASVVAVLRDGQLIPNPPAVFQLRAGDRLAVLGGAQELTSFKALVDAKTESG
jgi:CPA2 family monovalent cation:H+ antiporter-2